MHKEVRSGFPEDLRRGPRRVDFQAGLVLSYT